MALDRVMTNAELTEALAELKSRKLKISDLPMSSLRLELAKEPQNPSEILLPHSIGPDLLVTDPYAGYANGITGVGKTVTNTTYQQFAAINIPTTGVYLAGFEADTECNVEGALVLDLVLDTYIVQTVVNSPISRRIPDSATWVAGLIAGKTVQFGGFVVGAGAKYLLQNYYFWIARIA